MGYYNSIFNMGIKKFTAKCANSGVDGLIIVDLQPEEDADLYINVQGDEPIIDPSDISRVITASVEYPNDIINAMSKIQGHATSCSNSNLQKPRNSKIFGPKTLRNLLKDLVKFGENPKSWDQIPLTS